MSEKRLNKLTTFNVAFKWPRVQTNW